MSEHARRRWLAEPDWLEAYLHNPSVRVVDMRGVVETTTDLDGRQHAVYRGLREEYLAAHLPGAVYLDWTTDIVDLQDPVPAQAAPPERLAAVLGALGIDDQTLVVAYDTHPASQFATRLWWLLRYYGHDRVQVLNGGLPRWRRDGRPLSTEVPRYPHTVFTPRPRPVWRATAEEVVSFLDDPAVAVVDARDAGQYSGAVRRGPRGGRIPGAIHIPREALIDEAGTFRSNEALAGIARAAGLSPQQRVVAYCNGGVAATTLLFALSLLEYPRLTNYDGSWNEWSGRLDLPVEA
jgi:thiosulfate/3-mercaptopyruvate sulfurtransferase